MAEIHHQKSIFQRVKTQIIIKINHLTKSYLLKSVETIPKYKNNGRFSPPMCAFLHYEN